MPVEKRLEGKKALITGAARGIGLEFARAYVREGARVAIGDINEARAQEAAAQLGDGAIAIEMDVTRQESIERGVAQATSALGGIDILINNAALFTAAPVVEIERQDFDRTFAVNVAGTLPAWRSFSPRKRQTTSSRNVSTSTVDSG